MHILYVITRAEMGGSQTHVLDLLRGFQQDHQLTVATGEHGFLTEEAAKLGVNVEVLSNLVQPLQPMRDLRAVGELSRLIRRIKPDLVHCHTSKAGIVGRVAARLTSTPALFTAHTWSFADGTSKIWKLVGTPSERIAAKWTKRILAVSDSNRQLAIHRGVAPPEKIVTVHNGIEDTPLRAQAGRDPVPRIVMVARFAPQKNQAQLLEAVSEIDLPFKLTFVGDGPTRAAAESLAAERGLKDRVEFLGIRKDTSEILAAGSIFALATNWEGFPITILEAMRAGLPVVATDVDGVREAVTHNSTGYLVAKSDTTALRERIVELLGDGDKRSRLGGAGRARYESEFTNASMLRKIDSVYREIVPEARCSEVVLQSS
jgi:glycosyltransferase involved in cell wall biosynthesis